MKSCLYIIKFFKDSKFFFDVREINADFVKKNNNFLLTCVDPAFRLMRFPLDDELNFDLKNRFLLIKDDLESPLIFVLFLKGKQNKKEKP